MKELASKIVVWLKDYAEKVRGSLTGRLNGSDFALCLPAGGVGAESAVAIAHALQVVVPSIAPIARLAVGVVEVDRQTASTDLSRVLGAADAALSMIRFSRLMGRKAAGLDSKAAS